MFLAALFKMGTRGSRLLASPGFAHLYGLRVLPGIPCDRLVTREARASRGAPGILQEPDPEVAPDAFAHIPRTRTRLPSPKYSAGWGAENVTALCAQYKEIGLGDHLASLSLHHKTHCFSNFDHSPITRVIFVRCISAELLFN